MNKSSKGCHYDVKLGEFQIGCDLEKLLNNGSEFQRKVKAHGVGIETTPPIKEKGIDDVTFLNTFKVVNIKRTIAKIEHVYLDYKNSSPNDTFSVMAIIKPIGRNCGELIEYLEGSRAEPMFKIRTIKESAEVGDDSLGNKLSVITFDFLSKNEDNYK